MLKFVKTLVPDVKRYVRCTLARYVRIDKDDIYKISLNSSN